MQAGLLVGGNSYSASGQTAKEMMKRKLRSITAVKNAMTENSMQYPAFYEPKACCDHFVMVSASKETEKFLMAVFWMKR